MKRHLKVLKPDPHAVPPVSNGQPESDAARERCHHSGVTLVEATRLRAYQLWERAGRPDGDGGSFWLEAERALLPHR